MPFRFLRLRAWLARRTSTQLAAGIAVMAAVALIGSLMVTSAAVRMDQREKAALAALDDYSTMVEKLRIESSLTAADITPADAAYLSAWLSAFQDGPTRDAGSLEETCSTGQGGAGVRFIRAPVGKPAGLAALETTRGERAPRLGEGVHVLRLERGILCPARAVEVVVVRRSVGALDIAVGRVVDRSGGAWGWAVAAVAAAGVLLLVGDFSVRAPETAVAPELTELTGRVNLTLDRLEELLSWLRDSSDQLAHDFRTPLARASARLDRLKEASTTPEARALATEARTDLTRLTRAMNEAMALRDGEAWVFETVRLDRLAASAAELYQPLAEERNITIRVEAAAVSVLGVRSLLQRGVTNLVDNAVKFSPEGGIVTLTVGLEADKPVLSVADQGPGLDPDILDDPAEAVSRATGEGRESHGMGLVFVRAILKRHGAVMTIDDARPGAVVTARFSR